MNSSRGLAVLLLLVVALQGSPNAQSAASPRVPQSITSNTSAVLVDVVVRDRKGRPVTDLSASDFEIKESGSLQRIDTFSRVSHGSGIGVGVAWRSAPRTTVVASRTPDASVATGTDVADATTALVFDHLSGESLRLAQKATLDYVPMTGESGVRVGVFATDPGIRVVQPYTTDRVSVRQAIQRVVPSGVAAEEQKVERADELLSRRRSLATQNEALAAGAAAGAGPALARNASELGQRENELHMIQTELNMLRAFDTLDRDHRGYDTSLALLAVVQSLASLPGRKTIVFFSEGLPVSPVLSARLDYIIDVANRANVTTYAVDANGLRAKSSLANTRKELEGFADERLAQVSTGSDRTHQPLTMAFERVEDTLTLDSRTGLARLAEETGGFLVEQSNDLSGAFRRIDEDNQFHYLLTYSPSNTLFDGRFRPIQVRVRGAAYQVFARKGYRALAAPRGIDAGAFETPALALLDRTPLPNAFPVHAAAFSFPDPAQPGLTPILVRVGTGALRFTEDRPRATYSGQASVVVRIRDGTGHEVHTLSQQYVFSGAAADLDAAKRGELLFYREAALSPGVYTMETIVFDAAAGTGSARIATLNIPSSDASTVGMSSLVLVSRVEEVAEAPVAAPSRRAPLYVGRQLLYPNLGEPISKHDASELPFYFALYGDVSDAHVSAELLSNGRTVAQSPVELQSSTGSRLQHVGRLPIDRLPVGTYELKVRVTANGGETSRSAFFTIRE